MEVPHSRREVVEGGGARVVLTTFGSFGDLHPYLAIALALKARGHRPTLATSPTYRAKVEALGLAFHPIRPEVEFTPELARRVMDLHRGPEVVLREVVLPALRDMYEDLLPAGRGADLLLSHPLTFATRLAAEKLGVRWASSVLAPLSFFSAHDPPVLPNVVWLSALRPLGPLFHRALFGLMRWSIRSWSRPCRQLREELGLPPAPDPIFEGQHSPELVLALFSPQLGRPQPDWPPRTCVTGFCYFDQDGDAGLPEGLSRFLDSGPPPLVFTLGTSGVLDPGPFYQAGAEAARRLGRRAVLLVGRLPGVRPPGALPEGVAAFDYAPFSALFPRAAAVVHQGGVGTTGQALRAGVPMLVVPLAHDQPDNADRVRRLGVARVLPRARYTAARVVAGLRPLLEDRRYASRAAAVGRRVRAEDGAAEACAALEHLLGAPRQPVEV
jgi:UDP:flavonoid glycosyltransferase YjiC (YdhE family)